VNIDGYVKLSHIDFYLPLGLRFWVGFMPWIHAKILYFNRLKRELFRSILFLIARTHFALMPVCFAGE
jgi:hypothetical protein